MRRPFDPSASINNPDNPMHMTRHHREYVQLHFGKMKGDRTPTCLGDLARTVEPHRFVFNPAEPARETHLVTPSKHYPKG